MNARKTPWWGYLGWALVVWVAISVAITGGESLTSPLPWAVLIVGLALGITSLALARRAE